MVVALCLAAMIGGMVLGLRLQRPAEPLPAELALATPPAQPGPAQADGAELSARLAALQRAVAQEQTLLDALAATRAGAENYLAALEREIAAARREASLAAPQPPPPAAAPAPAPRREAAIPPIAAPVPRPLRAETASGSPRVFIHHRAGSAAGTEAASVLADTVREGGFEVPDIRPASSVPSQRSVRYFHAADAAAAARLAGRLGRGWAIQDFRGFDPAPAPGTLEVWVPDR
ncbi:coiled-coil domain-containing protein [Roseicella aquatilis]|uniref:Uncharacterized protein n=1 Tax=Roseicella aquatilis TaxID=2527868 RepID=A0A4R4DYY0_9PROT|nr:hypothetical protein [Roseicella aquatilis]TCZ66573.1 hypothetical protein EXY23_00190 [Roseicella aquatilis]